MIVKLRHENPEDYYKVEAIAREAFWNLYFPGCDEHYVIHKIRTHKDYIPELSFIVEVDGEIAGSIYYTKSKIINKDDSVRETISFGPVCIHPKYHRMGLGRQMITHTIDLAKEMGYKGIITLGYPYHYEPYGFCGGKKYHIAMEDGQFYIGLLALPLCDGGLDGLDGYARISSVFEVGKEEVEAYDQQFPAKEKAVTESQKEFLESVSKLDTKDYD
jgi:predicted N-acetyltransferase YhbS